MYICVSVVMVIGEGDPAETLRHCHESFGDGTLGSFQLRFSLSRFIKSREVCKKERKEERDKTLSLV